MMSPQLVVRDLGKRFGGVQAVDAVSFSIVAGSVHAVIGPNGAGKTTVFNLITGFYTPTQGTVEFEGQPITGLPTHQLARRGMSRTFQNLQVCMNMPAIDNVMIGAHLRLPQGLWSSFLHLPGLRRADKACRDQAAELMAFVGIGAYLAAHASEMPFGALKRLEIARALAAKPRMLLLDEPAAGLNDTETHAVAQLIRRIADSGTTVVLVEHDMKLVMSLSDHIVVLDHGRKLAEGTPDQVRRHPDVIAAYLGQS